MESETIRKLVTWDRRTGNAFWYQTVG